MGGSSVAGATSALVVGPAMTLVDAVPNASAPVSAAFDGHTLWVLFIGPDRSHDPGSPSLLAVREIESGGDRAVHALPAGYVGGRSALAGHGDGVAGVITHAE